MDDRCVSARWAGLTGEIFERMGVDREANTKRRIGQFQKAFPLNSYKQGPVNSLGTYEKSRQHGTGGLGGFAG